MFNRLKDMLIGFSICLSLVLGGVYAANYQAITAEFPILVNGESWTTDKPIVTIEGSTYLPLRALGEALDVKVAWNDELQRVEVGRTNPQFYEDFPDVPDFGYYTGATLIKEEWANEEHTEKDYLYSALYYEKGLDNPFSEYHKMLIDDKFAFDIISSEVDRFSHRYIKDNRTIGLSYLNSYVIITCIQRTQ